MKRLLKKRFQSSFLFLLFAGILADYAFGQINSKSLQDMKHTVSAAKEQFEKLVSSSSKKVHNNISPPLAWPHPFPCRIKGEPGDDIMFMTLGNVKTPVADGIFDPLKDEVTLNSGVKIENYFKDSLGIKFYKPIDKSAFPLPPSGWCSWYYYYQEINQSEIKKNAKWIADNLKDFGAKYIQIDDGWQGKGHGGGDNRDWTTVDRRFPDGMSALANYIKGLGLEPGLWLAPHGQSNPEVVKSNPNAFLMTKADTSASKTWEGEYLVDPSTSAGINYLKSLFTTLTGWGYDYFKIDGQPIVINEYRNKQKFMRNPYASPDSLYRVTLYAIRDAIGKNRYLLGCWGIPLDGTGIMNGSRTGGDVVLGWTGFMTSLDATMKYYFLHNIVWYSDPDVMLLRYPLSLNQARAWASLQGLTGQALMASDRMMDLSKNRVEILKRVFPAVDIRPLDLFSNTKPKHILDLKINHLGINYDVVGLFNYNVDSSEMLFLKWEKIGIEDTSLVHVYDFWNKEYIGAWPAGIEIKLPPASCRVLTLLPDNGQIRLISTSRHITQGWLDLRSAEYNPTTKTYKGRSAVVRNDPYTLTFVFPQGKNFKIIEANAGNLHVKVENHQGWATVQFTSPSNQDVAWSVKFDSASYYAFPVEAPTGIKVISSTSNSALISWDDQYYLNDGYEVFLNGKLIGYTPINRFKLTNLEPDRKYKVEVYSVWQNGQKSQKPATAEIFTGITHVNKAN
ncbi:MAG: alpha-galactosidase [Candidatus Kryptoniota bacterium]